MCAAKPCSALCICPEITWAQYEPRRPASRCRGQGIDPASWPGALEQRLKSRPSCGGLLLVPPKQATGDDVSCGSTWRQQRVQWRCGAPTNATEQRQQVASSTTRRVAAVAGSRRQSGSWRAASRDGSARCWRVCSVEGRSRCQSGEDSHRQGSQRPSAACERVVVSWPHRLAA